MLANTMTLPILTHGFSHHKSAHKRQPSGMANKKSNTPDGTRVSNEKKPGKSSPKLAASRRNVCPTLSQGSVQQEGVSLCDRTVVTSSDYNFGSTRTSSYTTNSMPSSNASEYSSSSYGSKVSLTSEEIHNPGAFLIPCSDLSQMSVPSVSPESQHTPVEFNDMSMTGNGGLSGVDFGPVLSQCHGYGTPSGFEASPFPDTLSYPMDRFTETSQESFSSFDTTPVHPPMAIDGSGFGYSFPLGWNSQATHGLPIPNPVDDMFPMGLPPGYDFPVSSQHSQNCLPEQRSNPAAMNGEAWLAGQNGNPNGNTDLYPSISTGDSLKITAFMEQQRFVNLVLSMPLI